MFDDRTAPKQLQRNALDADVHDLLLSVDGEATVHDNDSWLWGSVRRVRRGIEKLLGNGAAKPVKKHGRKVLRRRNTNDVNDDEDNDDYDGSGAEDDETLENFSKSGKLSRALCVFEVSRDTNRARTSQMRI